MFRALVFSPGNCCLTVIVLTVLWCDFFGSYHLWEPSVALLRFIPLYSVIPHFISPESYT